MAQQDCFLDEDSLTPSMYLEWINKSGYQW